ncbi:MAG: 50S ribosomal protein L31 [Patescibacteria group bacterium]
MKKDLHPQYFLAKVRCSCGNHFELPSTVESVALELCSACHPAFTGKTKLVDAAGRLDKFQSRLDKSQALKGQPKLP